MNRATEANTQMLPVVVAPEGRPRRPRAGHRSYSNTRLYRSRRAGRHVRGRRSAPAGGVGAVERARQAVIREARGLMDSGMWRPTWFVAFLSAGAVLLLVGSMWAIMGQRDGFFLMGIGVFSWGAAAILLAHFSLSKPKPEDGRRR